MSVYSELFSYRELFANLFRRDLQKRYKGSALGVVWVLLPPLILMAIYLLVFQVLWTATSQVPRYSLYLLSGLATWVFFATTLQVGSRAMLDNAELISVAGNVAGPYVTERASTISSTVNPSVLSHS